MPGDVSQLHDLVAPALRQFLRRRYRLLASEHDDLIQQTLEDLLRYFDSLDGALPDSAEWPALGTAILKRRVIDRFRSAVGRATVSIDEMMEEDLLHARSEVGVDQLVQYRQLLAVLLNLVGRLPTEDQGLLLEELDTSEHAPLTATSRKHLSRLRQRLREQLKSRVGPGADELFGRS